MKKLKINGSRPYLSVILATLLLFACFPTYSCASRENYCVSTELYAMDTYMQIKLYPGSTSEKAANEALAAAKAEILRIEALFSVTSESGAVAAINRGETLTLPSSDELVTLLELCGELNTVTSGRYDVTVYPLMLTWGFTGERDATVPSQEDVQKSLQNVGFSNITVTDNGDGTSTVTSNGAMLDLGSVAKGYAAQRAADVLTARGYSSFLIDLGGNIQTAITKPSGDSFILGIRDPNSSDPNKTSLLLNASELSALPFSKDGSGTLAIVTSGTYERYFEENGKRYHHILDATTGHPCDNGLSSVTVITDDGARADALSTALFLLGYDDALRYYGEQGGFEAVFISSDGSVTSTPGIRALISEQL